MSLFRKPILKGLTIPNSSIDSIKESCINTNDEEISYEFLFVVRDYLNFALPSEYYCDICFDKLKYFIGTYLSDCAKENRNFRKEIVKVINSTSKCKNNLCSVNLSELRFLLKSAAYIQTAKIGVNVPSKKYSFISGKINRNIFRPNESPELGDNIIDNTFKYTDSTIITRILEDLNINLRNIVYKMCKQDKYKIAAITIIRTLRFMSHALMNYKSTDMDLLNTIYSTLFEVEEMIKIYFSQKQTSDKAKAKCAYILEYIDDVKSIFSVVYKIHLKPASKSELIIRSAQEISKPSALSRMYTKKELEHARLELLKENGYDISLYRQRLGIFRPTIQNQIDHTSLYTITVDNYKFAKNLSDAITISKSPDGCYEVCIHTPDVASYLDCNPDIAVEAEKRLEDIDGMELTLLPRNFANNILSLYSGKISDAITYHCTYAPDGTLLCSELRMYPSLIMVDRNLTNQEVDDFYKNGLSNNNELDSAIELFFELGTKIIERENGFKKEKINSSRILETFNKNLELAIANYFMNHSIPSLYATRKSWQTKASIKSYPSSPEQIIHTTFATSPTHCYFDVFTQFIVHNFGNLLDASDELYEHYHHIADTLINYYNHIQVIRRRNEKALRLISEAYKQKR